jgi:hypothetical protein
VTFTVSSNRNAWFRRTRKSRRIAIKSLLRVAFHYMGSITTVACYPSALLASCPFLSHGSCIDPITYDLARSPLNEQDTSKHMWCWMMEDPNMHRAPPDDRICITVACPEIPRLRC